MKQPAQTMNYEETVEVVRVVNKIIYQASFIFCRLRVVAHVIEEARDGQVILS